MKFRKERGEPAEQASHAAARAETANTILSVRRMRTAHFDHQLFGEQGWELLLHLFTRDGAPVTIAAAAADLGLSPQTAMALSRLLVASELAEQIDSEGSWDQIQIRLTATGTDRMERYLDAFREFLQAA